MYDPLLRTIAFHPSLALLRQESSSASYYNRKVFGEHYAAHAVACGGDYHIGSHPHQYIYCTLYAVTHALRSSILTLRRQAAV
jgi:hypothetical protein